MWIAEQETPHGLILLRKHFTKLLVQEWRLFLGARPVLFGLTLIPRLDSVLVKRVHIATEQTIFQEQTGETYWQTGIYCLLGISIDLLLVLVVIACEVGVKHCRVFAGGVGQKLVQVWISPVYRVVCLNLAELTERLVFCTAGMAAMSAWMRINLFSSVQSLILNDSHQLLSVLLFSLTYHEQHSLEVKIQITTKYCVSLFK